LCLAVFLRIGVEGRRLLACLAMLDVLDVLGGPSTTAVETLCVLLAARDRACYGMKIVYVSPGISLCLRFSASGVGISSSIRCLRYAACFLASLYYIFLSL